MKKIFNLSLKSFLLLLGFNIVSCTTIACVSKKNDVIVFANFESYMNPKLKESIRKDFTNIRFDYYTSNENMISNFKNGSYTIGVPSTYCVIDLIKQEQLLPINWKLFELINPKTRKLIENADDALSLFTKPVQNILQSYKNIGIENLLEYCVPYFLQNFIFAYRGNEIRFNNKNISWLNILENISNNSIRFNNNRLGSIEDERTLFSVANILVDESVDNIDVNNSFLINEKPQISDYVTIYENWSKSNRINKETLNNNPQPIFLNSDSSIILNKLAENTLQGAFLFNGDAIFAAQGGEIKSTISTQNFHFVVPEFTPISLDAMVINKSNVENDAQRINDIHQIIKKIGLEGSDCTNLNLLQQKNNQSDYKYGPMINFSYLQYTSPLQIIDNVVKNDDYFEKQIEDKNLAKKIKNVYDIKLPTTISINKLVELPINTWQRQTMINAYFRFKEKMWS